MIQCECPSCKEKLTFDDDAAGQTLPCRACHVPLKVAAPITYPPSPKRWYFLAGLAVVAGVGAWLLAGYWIWPTVCILGALGMVYYLLGLGSRLIRRMKIERYEVHNFVYFVCLVGGWIGIGFWFQSATIHVDNFSTTNLRVLRDGAEWFTIPAGTTRVETVRHGPHRFTVLNTDGQQLDDLVEIAAVNGVYVLNLLKAQKYVRGKVRYGGSFYDSSEPKEVDDVWIEAKVDYLFADTPESILVSSGKNDPVKYVGTSKSYLRRRLAVP